MVIENLVLNVKEHKLLKKYKHSLEKQHGVVIHVPNVDKCYSEKDIIFGSVSGIQQSIDSVKRFLSKRLNKSSKSSEWKYPDGIVLVTLSDSEDESSSESDSSTICPKSILSLANLQDESVCISESIFGPKNSPNQYEMNSVDSTVSPNVYRGSSSKKLTYQNKINSVDSTVSLNDSMLIIDSPSSAVTSEVCRNAPNKKQKIFPGEKGKSQNKVRKTPFLPSSSDAEDQEICDVSSTTKEPNLKLCKEFEKASTAPIVKKTEHAPDFIALYNDNCSREIPLRKRKRSPVMVNKDVVVLDSPEVKKTIPVTPRRLRPVVIDGSNVAREHGKVNGVFSSKGIKLCVDYFLNRGHTQVTAFVPIFRRHGDRRKFFPTTDQPILEELAKKQHVVFTPSRKVNGQCFSSYDDRFVVQLAEKNGGVIVSNDNFKDLLSESESFKKVIEERLLMFCFVGDEFMVPDDPLGRNGPRLNEYLSFPPEENKK